MKIQTSHCWAGHTLQLTECNRPCIIAGKVCHEHLVAFKEWYQAVLRGATIGISWWEVIPQFFWHLLPCVDVPKGALLLFISPSVPEPGWIRNIISSYFIPYLVSQTFDLLLLFGGIKRPSSCLKLGELSIFGIRPFSLSQFAFMSHIGW